MAERKVDQKQEGSELKAVPIPFDLGQINENISITTNTSTKPSKEQIINQAFKFHSAGNLSQAVKYYQYFINPGYKDHRIFSNYGKILKDLGKLQDAELLIRKAIELKPDFAETHSNLGGILKDLGKLKEAELSYRKAIEINPNFTEAHYNLGGILIHLEKLKEARLCSEKIMSIKSWSILGSYSFNREMKLD